MKWTFASLDEEALANLGRKLSTYVKAGVVFSLSGKLGSGKTTSHAPLLGTLVIVLVIFRVQLLTLFKAMRCLLVLKYGTLIFTD